MRFELRTGEELPIPEPSERNPAMNTRGFIPGWAREVFNFSVEETLSTERLALLLHNKRPPGAAVELEACFMWAELLLEEPMSDLPAESTEARIRRELRERLTRPWPDGGVLNSGC